MARLSKLPEVLEGPDPGIGHNQSPEPIEAASLTMDATAWSEWMAQVLAQPRRRVTELLVQFEKMRKEFPLEKPLAAGGKPKGIDKWDDQVQGRFGDLRAEFLGQIKVIEAAHDIEKEPIIRAGKAVDGATNTLIAEVAVLDGKRKLIPGQTAPLNWIRDHCTWYAEWKAAESQRIAAEEAAEKRRLAEEAAAAAARTEAPEAMDQVTEAFQEAERAEQVAAAPVAQHSRVHGSFGSTTSLRTTWTFVEAESDLMALAKAVVAGEAPIKYLAFDSVAIGRAARSEGLRELPGCVIKPVRSV